MVGLSTLSNPRFISATLPHGESFGLAPELFRRSSGEVAAPKLIFSHWERFDQDPFWIPTSLEEREDLGEILQNGDVSTGMDNTALKCIRKARERKGLLVDSSRTVVAAENKKRSSGRNNSDNLYSSRLIWMSRKKCLAPIILQSSNGARAGSSSKSQQVSRSLYLIFDSRLVNAVIIVHQEAMEGAGRPHACNMSNN
jgi:hypothetical protein